MLIRHLNRLLYGGGFLLDDVAITAGIGTAISADLIGGVYVQRNKLIHGIDGVSAGDVALTNGLPVQPMTAGGSTPFPTVAGFKTTEQYTRAVVSCAASGDNIIVASVAAQFVRVYGLLLLVDIPVSVKLGDLTPAFFTGAMKFSAGGGLFLPAYGEPYFITAVGKGFNINLSAAVQCSGVIWYQQGV